MIQIVLAIIAAVSAIIGAVLTYRAARGNSKVTEGTAVMGAFNNLVQNLQKETERLQIVIQAHEIEKTKIYTELSQFRLDMIKKDNRIAMLERQIIDLKFDLARYEVVDMPTDKKGDNEKPYD